MERRIINTLIVNDDDLDCKKDKLTLDNLSIASLGFILGDIAKFDAIIYSGKLGSKILKSKYYKTGKIC